MTSLILRTRYTFVIFFFSLLRLGPNGEPLRDVSRNLPSLQSSPPILTNPAPAPVAPPISNAAASLLSQPNLSSNLAALSNTLSGLTGVGALSNSVLSSAAASLGLGLGNDLSNSANNPAFSTSTSSYNTGGGGRGDFDLGVRNYSSSNNDDFGGGGGGRNNFGNGRAEPPRLSDTIIIRNVSLTQLCRLSPSQTLILTLLLAASRILDLAAFAR